MVLKCFTQSTKALTARTALHLQHVTLLRNRKMLDNRAFREYRVCTSVWFKRNCLDIFGHCSRLCLVALCTKLRWLNVLKEAHFFWSWPCPLCWSWPPGFSKAENIKATLLRSNVACKIQATHTNSRYDCVTEVLFKFYGHFWGYSVCFCTGIARCSKVIISHPKEQILLPCIL